MKKIIKLISLVSILTVLLNTTVFAKNVDSVSIKEANEIIISQGLPEILINKIPEDSKIKLAAKIKKDPSKVQLSVQSTKINELEVIETIVNLSDDELRNSYGFNDEKLKKARRDIKELSNKSDSELKNKYKKSDLEIKLLREVLKPRNSFKKILKKGNIATTSSEIGENDLYTYLFAYNIGSTSKVRYDISAGFCWLDKPLLYGYFDDTFALAWGGNLALDDYTLDTTVAYVDKIYPDDPNAGWEYVEDLKGEEFINSALKFDYAQQLSKWRGWGVWDYYYADWGFFGFELFQNIKNKPAIASKIVAQYGNGKSIWNLGMTVTGSGPEVGLSLGTGYNTSPQIRAAIEY